MTSAQSLIAFALAASALILPAASFADSACGARLEEWDHCAVTSDCVIERDACYQNAAYNKKHVEAAKEYNLCIHPMIRCAAPPPDDVERTIAVCLNGKCAAVKPEAKKDVS